MGHFYGIQNISRP